MVMLCQVCEYTYSLLPSETLALCSLAEHTRTTVKKRQAYTSGVTHALHKIHFNQFLCQL